MILQSYILYVKIIVHLHLYAEKHQHKKQEGTL
jgi:hypothetical protein